MDQDSLRSLYEQYLVDGERQRCGQTIPINRPTIFHFREGSRVLATVFATAWAVLCALLGCTLIVRGLTFFPGVLLVGSHGVAAAAITILAGIVSLIVAAGLCVPLVWLVEHRQFPPDTKRIPHIEAHLRVLTPEEGYDGGPIRSGFCATLQYGPVVDEVVFMLVGVSQLATGEDGTVRLSLANSTNCRDSDRRPPGLRVPD
jgi:hypothetical protein